MKNKNVSGISLSLNKDETSRDFSVIIICLLTVFTYISVVFSFFSMLEMNIKAICMAPVAIIIAEYLLSNKKEFFSGFNAVLLAAVGLLILIRFDDFANGAKLIFNKIFEISEKYQAYLYDKFETSVLSADFNKNILMFIFPVSIILSCLLSYCSLKSKGFGILTIALIALCIEIYFGIAPRSIWNIVLFVSLILLSAFAFDGKRKNKVMVIKNSSSVIQTISIFILVCTIISTAVYTVYPSEYRNSAPIVQQANEAIRDIFDEGEQSISNRINQNQSQPNSNQADNAKDNEGDNAKSESGNENGSGGSRKRASNASRVYINFISFIVALLAVLAVLVWFIVFVIKSVKRKKALSSDDLPSVVRFAFALSMKWLNAYGLKPENIMLSDYKSRIEKLISSELAEQYENALNVWQEVTYSNNAISVEKKNIVADFYDLTRKIVWKRSNIFKKFKIKLIKFL